MYYYVSHAYGGNQQNYERAKEITHDLQIEQPQDCFICPLLTFSHLGHNEIGYEKEMALCLDILQICDCLIVASEISEGVRREIELAQSLKNSNGEPMEVIYLVPQNT